MDAIFQALCEGALANPDPDAEEDEGDFFYDEVTICFRRPCPPEHNPPGPFAHTLQVAPVTSRM